MVKQFIINTKKKTLKALLELEYYHTTSSADNNINVVKRM